MSQFDCFVTPNAQAINRARQEHLDSLGLDIAPGRRVLEVGAGIGYHTGFFLDKGCDVVSSDGRADNVAEIRRRWPGLSVHQIDLESDSDLARLGTFDLIYCYGLLYHVGDPDRVLAMLAQICTGQIMLELIVNMNTKSSLDLVREPDGFDQSITRQGCRPSRSWVLDRLQNHWGHGYITATQPDHAEFLLDWTTHTVANTRAVFVGSRTQLKNPLLVRSPPQNQSRCKKSSQ